MSSISSSVIYKKYRNGDHLTDAECQYGEKFFRETSERLRGIPEYHLIRCDMLHTSEGLGKFLRNRGLDKLL
jgi:hypothetical protein